MMWLMIHRSLWNTKHHYWNESRDLFFSQWSVYIIRGKIMWFWWPYFSRSGLPQEQAQRNCWHQQWERDAMWLFQGFFFCATVNDWLLILGIKQLSMWCLFGLYSLSNLPAFRNFLCPFSHNGSPKLIRAECMSLLTAAKYSEFLRHQGLNNTSSS